MQTDAIETDLAATKGEDTDTENKTKINPFSYRNKTAASMIEPESLRNTAEFRKPKVESGSELKSESYVRKEVEHKTSEELVKTTAMPEGRSPNPSSRKPAGRSLKETGKSTNELSDRSLAATEASPVISAEHKGEMSDYIKALQTRDIALVRRFSVSRKFVLNQWTSLMLVIPGKNDELFSHFHKEASMSNPSGLTPLMIASYHGAEKFVDELSRDCNYSLLEATYNSFPKEQAVHIALRRGNFRIAHILLEKSVTCGLNAEFIKASAGKNFKFQAAIDSVGRSELMYCAMQPTTISLSTPTSPTASVSQLFSEESTRFETHEPRECDFESLAPQEGILDDNSLSALMYAVIYNNMSFINYVVDTMGPEIGLRTINEVRLVFEDDPFRDERIISIPVGSTGLVIATILNRNEAAFALRPVECQFLTEDGKSWSDFSDLTECSTNVVSLGFNRRLAIENNRRACEELLELESYAGSDCRMSKMSTSTEISQMCQILGCTCDSLIESIKKQEEEYEIVSEQQEAAQIAYDAQELEILQRTEELSKKQRELTENDELAAELRHAIMNLSTRSFCNRSEQVCPDSRSIFVEANTKDSADAESEEMQTGRIETAEEETQTVISADQMRDMGRFMLTVKKRIERIQNQIYAAFKRLRLDREEYKSLVASYCQRLNQIDNLSFEPQNLGDSNFGPGSCVVSAAQLLKQQKSALEVERDIEALLRENSALQRKIRHHELLVQSVEMESPEYSKEFTSPANVYR